MGHTFAIVCDSAADLSAAWYVRNDVRVVPLGLRMPTGAWPDVVKVETQVVEAMLERDVPVEVIYPTAAHFQEVFRDLMDRGFDSIVCVCSAREGSAVQDQALRAAQAASTTLPVRVEVVDSRATSLAEGMLVCDLARCRDSGMGFEEALAHIATLSTRASFALVLPPDTQFSRGPKVKLAARSHQAIDRLLGLWSLATFDGRGVPRVVGRARDAESLSRLVVQLMLVDSSREGPIAYGLTGVGGGETARLIERNVRLRMPDARLMGSVKPSGAVALRMGLGAAGIAWAPERYLVQGDHLPRLSDV